MSNITCNMINKLLNKSITSFKNWENPYDDLNTFIKNNNDLENTRQTQQHEFEKTNKILQNTEMEVIQRKNALEDTEKEEKIHENKFLDLVNEKTKLEALCKMNEKKTVPCDTDLKVLQNVQSKLVFYKDVTGIRWDFTVPPEECTGYIKNNRNHYLKPFSLKNTKTSTMKLWGKIGAAAHSDWSNNGQDACADTGNK